MFVNLSYFNLTPITNNPLPSFKSKTYNGIKIYGQGTFHKLHGRNITIENNDLELLAVDYNPSWDADTFVLSTFNGSLSSGTIEYINSEVTRWLIYRKDNNNSLLKLVDEVPAYTTSYNDFSVTKGNEYTYYLFATNDTEISAPLVSERIACDYWGWFLINADDKKSYQFDSNFEGGSLTSEEYFVEYQNNTPYSLFNRGKHKSFSGQIQAIIWDVNSPISFEQGNAILAEIRDLIHSNKNTYLKDRRGRMWKVFLYGYSENLLHKDLAEQIISCTFSFKQIDDEYSGGENL